MSTKGIAPATQVAAADQITLRSSDNESFVIDVKVARLSSTLKNLIDDGCADTVVPLPNVTGSVLSKVIEFCKKHAEPVSSTATGRSAEECLKEWDDEFIDVDQASLFELISAANYLDIKELLELTCQTVADMIKGKTPEEVRLIFNISNDFTPEEEEEIRTENQWAFE